MKHKTKFLNFLFYFVYSYLKCTLPSNSNNNIIAKQQRTDEIKTFNANQQVVENLSFEMTLNGNALK